MTLVLSPRAHDPYGLQLLRGLHKIGYWTVTVTVEVVCPNAFVAYRV